MLKFKRRRSEFKLPWISPLAGATWPIIRKVLEGKKLDPKYHFKIRITYLFVTTNALFRWFDHYWYRRKLRLYVFKEAPLFIIGHWRSGTTYLHNLMTQDPLAGYTTTYQCVFPDNMKSKWVFKTFMSVFMPRVRPGDNLEISASWPQEDEYAMSNLTPHSFYHFFYFPTRYRSLYRKYIRFESFPEKDLGEWKKLYRQLVIKALINTGGSRAVLKSPVNTARMPCLSELFPGARFILIIRNPVIVYLSTKKFFGQLLPTLQLEPFTEKDISELILDVYVNMIRDYLEDKKRIDPDHLLEIKYEDLVKNPMENLAIIYKRFQYPGYSELEPVFLDYLDSIKDHRADHYTISQADLDRVISRVGFAMKHWQYGIPERLKTV